MEEIKDVLRKHDISASIALHTPGHGEFLNYFLTTYSCAYQYEDDSIRFYAKRKDFKTSKEHVAKLRDTSNMLHILTQLTAQNFMMLEPLSKKIDGLTNAEHG